MRRCGGRGRARRRVQGSVGGRRGVAAWPGVGIATGGRTFLATASHFFSKTVRHFLASSCATEPFGLYIIAFENVRCTASAISSAPW